MPYSTVSFRITLMTLSDLAKYSMTQSVVRSLCDSWASCLWHRQSVYDFLLVWSVTPQSSNRVSTSLGNSGLCWTVFTWNRDTAVPAEGNCDLQTLICVLVARPRRCLTLSNLVPWQIWMAAYLGYTLRMKTLFRAWPVMVHDMRTRRSRSAVLCTMHIDGQLYCSVRLLFMDARSA